MSFFTDLNKYVETLGGWVLYKKDKHSCVLYLDSLEDSASITIEYHQEMIVNRGKVKPYNWGNVGLAASGNLPFEQAEKMVNDLNEIMRKNT